MQFYNSRSKSWQHGILCVAGSMKVQHIPRNMASKAFCNAKLNTRVFRRHAFGFHVKTTTTCPTAGKLSVERKNKRCRTKTITKAEQGKETRGGAGGHVNTTSSMGNRTDHNIEQSQFFDGEVEGFKGPLPNKIQERLTRIASSVPGLGSHSRVVDAGCGIGALIPFIKERGVEDIVAVDVSPKMLSELEKEFPNPGKVGNTLGVRTWCGDVIDLPDFMGPVDAIFFNACFGNIFSEREALLRSAFVMRPGGYAIISHPLGRKWQVDLHKYDRLHVPHEIPSQDQWHELIHDLPFELVNVEDEPDFYLALLKVPSGYAFKGSPLFLEGKVVEGVGRGSKQMGIPTANLAPEPLQEAFKDKPKGVYFGFAQLQGGGSFPEQDYEVFPMVMNIGERPTVQDGRGVTIEVHVMHNYEGDFHGEMLKVVVLGFLRPEIRFSGLDPLIARIKTDIGISKSQLQAEELASMSHHPFFDKEG